MIITAPSGAGKTTLCRALTRHDKRVRYSVSVTTRPRQSKEKEGTDYFFVTPDEFSDMVKKGELLEWEEVYGYQYGTPRKNVEEKLNQGLDVVLDLDIKGALHVKELYPGSVSVFLLPPTLTELHQRLTRRGRDSRKVIEERLAQARSELKRARDFDYVIVNDSLAESVHLLTSIIEAERAHTERITKIELLEV